MPLFTGLSLLVSQSGFRRLVVSGSPDVSLHLSPFICLPLWLVVSGCLLFAFTWLPSFFSYHLSPDSSVSQLMCPVCLSGGVWFFRLFAFVRVFHHFFLTIGLPLHLSPHSYVSPSGGVLLLFHHDFICGWSLSLFFSPFVSSCCLRSYTSIDPR